MSTRHEAAVSGQRGGALGAVLVGIIAFQEPVTAPRLIFLALLLVGIVGLKLME